MSKQFQYNFERIAEMHYMLSMLTKCNVEVYDDEEFRKSNLFFIKNEFAILFSLDSKGEIDFGVVITNSDDLDRIYRNIKNKFDLAELLINTISDKEIEEKGLVFNFYNSDKFDFLFNVNFDYLRPKLMVEDFKDIKIKDKEFSNLEEIIEKKLMYSNINIFIVKDMLNDHIYSTLIHSGNEKVKELFERIELIIKYMEINKNIKLYFMNTTKFDSDTIKYSLGVFGSEQFILIKKPAEGREGNPSFYMIKNPNMLKYIEKTYEELCNNVYVQEITASEFSESLSKYKKLI